MKNKAGFIIQVIGVILVFLTIINFWTEWFSRLWAIPATVIYCVGLAMNITVIPMTENKFEEELEI